jgi:gamma-glutamyltranspeptidase/glutathione hydrolase
MVAAAHPLATEAGVRMLELGGTAADAAVAAAFAAAVVEPSMNSIGGRTQILLRDERGELRGIDATTAVPRGYDAASAPRAGSGYPTVGVPGAVAGLLRLHREEGRLDLATVMAPAIEIARRGYELLPGAAVRHSFGVEGLSAGAAALLLEEDGSAYDEGDVFVQADLARTLEAIARGGHDAFYGGRIARRIAADMKRNRGYVDRASLADYRAEDARVVRGSYRGYELVGTDVPAAGAVSIEALHILEHFPMAELEPVAWAAVVGQALALAFEDSALLGSEEAAVRVTSKQHAAERARLVNVPSVRAAARDAVGGAELVAGHDWTGATWGAGSTHTTHLSTADSGGRFVSLTQTIGPLMGSKVATPGLGFLYAATMGGYLGDMVPGQRARSFISPLAVLEGGEVRLVLGAAGGSRIVSAVVQTVLRVIDQGRPLAEALAAPRVHPAGAPGRPPAGGMALETTPGSGWAAATADALEGEGFEIQRVERAGAFGRVHGLELRDGEWVGAADPDWEGSALAPAAQPAGSAP